VTAPHPVLEVPRIGRRRGVRRGGRRTTGVALLLWVLGAAVAAAVLYPLGTIVGHLFVSHGHVTAEPVREAVRVPGLATAALNTVFVVGIGGVIALVVATVLAWFAERTDATLGPVANIVPVVPLFVPPLAGAIGWVFLLAPTAGMLNAGIRSVFGLSSFSGPLDIETRWGMVFVTALYLVPYAYLIVAAALREVDPDLEAASRVSGAGVRRTFLRVTLPTIRPALVSACVILVMMGLALLSVPVVIGTPARVDVISVVIYRVMLIESPPQLAQGIVLSFFVVAVILLALGVQWAATRGRRFELLAGRAKARRRVRLGRWKWLARGITIAYILLAVVLPLVALVIVSLERFWSATIPWHALGIEGYREVFRTPLVVDALRHSVILGAGAAVVGMLVAFGLAWWAQTRRSGRGRGTIMGVAALPAGIPHLVFGVGFLIAFSQWPLRLYGSLWLLLIAYVTIWLPQAMQAARNGVRRVGRDLIEASQIAGASEGRTIRRIGVPLALPQMTSGILILFVLAMSEFNASIMLTTPTNNTAGPMLFSLWNNGNYPSVAAFSLVICAINVVVTAVALTLTRRVRRDL
jgi:iron(III) transport system permease protein